MNKKIILKKGVLTKHGYSLDKNATCRRRALMRASKIGGKLSKPKLNAVRKRMTILKTFTKNTQPKNSQKYSSDAKWLSNVYKKKYNY